MFVNRYLVPWMSLAATGRLWIGDAEHAARLKEADTGVEQTLPTDTATPVEVETSVNRYASLVRLRLPRRSRTVIV